MFLNFDITHIPADVKKLAEKAANWTKTIEGELNSSKVIDLAKLIPDGEVAREALIAICETAIHACDALIQISDNAGVQARLQRLGSDIVALQHSSEKHTISFYIISFETVFRDLFGKK